MMGHAAEASKFHTTKSLCELRGCAERETLQCNRVKKTKKAALAFTNLSTAAARLTPVRTKETMVELERDGRKREMRTGRRAAREDLGALEHVLHAVRRVDHVVLRQVVPHVPVLVVPSTKMVASRAAV
jgi:hypothetical protein